MPTDTLPPSGDVIEDVRKETRKELKEPPRFRVLIVNDDFTPADFVIRVLMKVFNLGYDSALAVMIETHRNGVGSCGVYPHDVAETKVGEVMTMAQAYGHPLLARKEPA